jgi:hypothetical protein
MPRQTVCSNPACNHRILKSHESYWENFYPVKATFCRKCWNVAATLSMGKPVEK